MDFENDIFNELEEFYDDHVELLRLLEANVESCEFLIIADTGKKVSQNKKLNIDINLYDKLADTIKTQHKYIITSDDGIIIFTEFIKKLDGILFYCFNDYNNEKKYLDKKLIIDFCIKNYLAEKKLRNEKELQKIKEEQLPRKINVLNKKNHAILEKNHKVHRMIQKQQEDYANELSEKINEQTKELRQRNKELIKSRKFAEATNRAKSEFLAI